MRKKLIAGNWKMNLNFDEAISLISDLVGLERVSNWKEVDIAVFPPAFYTRHTFEFFKNASSNIGLGVQDCSTSENGAFTGDLSAQMAKSAGADSILIGHSERRAYYDEGPMALNDKLKKALAEGLNVIYCCGELLEDRKANKQFDVVKQQLADCISGLNQTEMNRVVIAYEPVWAIGTGETATPEQAQEMHAFIRNWIKRQFDDSIGDNLRILYGGSMKPENAAQLLSQPDVDGGLIGGASLKVDQFGAIINEAVTSK